MEAISKNSFFDGIKCRYILQKIFNKLLPKKVLQIIKYNNNLKKQLNKDINDYKQSLQIEIEILPEKDKYGKFITISDKSFYHIYFNDNKEEVKKNYIDENDKIIKVKILIDYEIKSLKGLFEQCKCIKKINFIKFNRKDINDISYMFCNCNSLEEINLNNFNTDKVTDMSYMLSKCSSLQKINLSNFNTNNVINMNHMFDGCIILKFYYR